MRLSSRWRKTCLAGHPGESPSYSLSIHFQERSPREGQEPDVVYSDCVHPCLGWRCGNEMFPTQKPVLTSRPRSGRSGGTVFHRLRGVRMARWRVVQKPLRPGDPAGSRPAGGKQRHLMISVREELLPFPALDSSPGLSLAPTVSSRLLPSQAATVFRGASFSETAWTTVSKHGMSVVGSREAGSCCF